MRKNKYTTNMHCFFKNLIYIELFVLYYKCVFTK